MPDEVQVQPAASFLDVTGLAPDEIAVLEAIVERLRKRGVARIGGVVVMVHAAEKLGLVELARAFAMELLTLCRERAVESSEP